MRMIVATLIIWLLCVFKGRKNPIKQRLMLQMFWLGILNFGIPWACLFWGEQFIHPSIAAIINSSVPLFVLIFSWFMLTDDRPTLSGTIGVLLGFLGMFCVFSPNIQDYEGHASELAGMLSILVMSVSYALGAIGIRRLPKGTDMRWAFVFQGVSAFVFLIVASWLKGETLQDTSKLSESIGGVLYLAICSSAIASLIFYHLISEWGALKATAVTYVSPIVAVIADLYLLQVQPKPNQLLGGGLILGGLLLIHWAKTKNFHKSIGSALRRK